MRQVALIIRLDEPDHGAFKALCKANRKTMAKAVRAFIRRQIRRQAQ